MDVYGVSALMVKKMCDGILAVLALNRDRAAGLRELRDPRGDRDTASGQGALAH
jgi:hypothetical protein